MFGMCISTCAMITMSVQESLSHIKHIECESCESRKSESVAKCYHFDHFDHVADEAKPRSWCERSLIWCCDTFVSVFVVAALIVSQWRGTWCLMDFYSHIFRTYESFLFSTALHIALAIVKDVVRDNIFDYSQRYRDRCGWKLFIKCYIYCFNIICNMQWRGGWEIFDEMCGIETDDLGNAYSDNDVTMVIYLTLCFTVLLALFKGLRNTAATPFLIVLDTEEEIFHFPTRFRVKVFYLSIFLLKESVERQMSNVEIAVTMNPQNSTLSTKSSANAEKLVASESKVSPRPFLTYARGPAPATFERSTSVYPQLQNYVPPNHPRNIQEIINYIAPEPQSSSKKIVFPKYDIFHSYKPKDPGDINLLATANVRFAPPIWKEFKSNPQVAQSVQKPFAFPAKKPITLTLNLFPMHNEHYFALPGGKTNTFTAADGSKKLMKPRKMVIHLNVFQPADFERTGYDIQNDFQNGNYDLLPDIITPRLNQLLDDTDLSERE